jgi:prophage DNA circulation protein
MDLMGDARSPWLDNLQPASFRGAFFHVDAGARESGRRIVVHEFPKKDVPYPEDMGRRAIQFSVRGYCVQYPFNLGPLRQRDFRIPRDTLIAALEMNGPGVLQLPTTAPISVVCPQYRWTEEEKTGGYCTFDMTFTEYGVPTAAQPLGRTSLLNQANVTEEQIIQNLGNATSYVALRELLAEANVTTE